MAQQRKGKPKIGRPGRTDNPAKVLLVLPGVVRQWLKAQATREKRSQGDIVTDALGIYRKRKGGKR